MSTADDEVVDALLADYLAHYGVKGMKWGVINEDGPVGDTTGGSTNKKVELSQLEKDVLDVAAKQGMTDDRMRSRFGPDSVQTQKERRQLSEGQKKALKGAVVIGGAALAIYALNKYGDKILADQLNSLGENGDSKNLVKFWKEHQAGVHRVPFQPGFNFEKMSDVGVDLSAGSILSRISTDQELNIRPGGFYAAFKPEDVQRYKAVLPVYWKQWGIANETNTGYEIALKAKTAIKAPSPKETFKMFADFIGDDGDTGFAKVARSSNNIAATVYAQAVKNGGMSKEAAAKDLWGQFAASWTNNDDPIVSGFFDRVKSSGYNALIDINDAGSIGDAPLRVLDGTLFDHAGAKELSRTAIKSAQENLVRLKHESLEEAPMHDEMVDDLLADYMAHYGIKGQKWGVRRTPKQLGKGSEDFERAFAARTKATTQGRHTLSNKELQDAVTRMNLEKQYNSLASPTPAAQQFVVGIMKDIGRETLKGLLKEQITAVIKK